MNKVHVKTGDTVEVISGKDKGKRGQVLAVSPEEGKVIVEKIRAVSSRLRALCMLPRSKSYARAAKKPPESLTSCMRTASRAESAQNAAKNFKED